MLPYLIGLTVGLALAVLAQQLEPEDKLLSPDHRRRIELVIFFVFGLMLYHIVKEALLR